MLATVAAADSASTVRKKYSISIYSEAEPHAMYALYKLTRTLCVLQYLSSCCPFNLLPVIFQKSIVPCLQLAVLVGLVSLPVTTIPYPVVWVYDKALWMSEPMWLILEVTEVLTGVMALSQTLVNKMEDEDSGLIKVKMASGIST